MEKRSSFAGYLVTWELLATNSLTLLRDGLPQHPVLDASLFLHETFTLLLVPFYKVSGSMRGTHRSPTS